MRALTADVAINSEHYKQVLSGEDSQVVRGNCLFENSPTCVQGETADILSAVNAYNPDLPNGLLGSLNHDSVMALPESGSAGIFSMEMDDFVTVPGGSAGYDNSTTKIYQFTVLTVGQIMPAGAAAGACTSAFALSTGLQRLRGQIIFGPL
jgi:hypothetical protein